MELVGFNSSFLWRCDYISIVKTLYAFFKICFVLKFLDGRDAHLILPKKDHSSFGMNILSDLIVSITQTNILAKI
jgi:hypothetical protein